ncbi:MAG: MBL fold metallo-hydrolase [Planctomycetota bacterium]
MLSSLLGLSFLCCLPQGSGAGEELAPVGLEVINVDVGQGSATVIRVPDGTVHVIDGGRTSAGVLDINPVIRSLQPTSYGLTLATHFDADHIGGLDEVLLTFPFVDAYDRGNVSVPSTGAASAYLSAAGARRRQPTPGQVIPLGAGATLTVIAENGRIAGGGSVSVAGSQQEENARSVVVRLDYGDFSMWIGGDLTGGGNGTADVESAASLACGNVDVYVADHHGSNTSSNATLVNQLAPEVVIISAGCGNPFGHPTPTVLNRINSPGACRATFGTTEGAGAVGFAVAGDVSIVTDGTRYRTTAANGEWLDFFVDEVLGRTPASTSVRITEVHRNPASVPDSSGEYFEVTNVSGLPVTARGLRFVTRSGSFTMAADLALLPGRPVIFAPDGLATRNGGLPLPVCWPFSSLGSSGLGDSIDQITVFRGLTPFDAVSWNATWPGGSGVAIERRDLLGSSASTNFADAPAVYGAGDQGSPAARNPTDDTAFPATVFVSSTPGELLVRSSALSHGLQIGAVGLAFGNTGFPFMGQQIPLDPDPLLTTSLSLPGFVDLLPLEGYRTFALPMPVPNPAAGTTGFAAHMVFGLFSQQLEAVSGASPFVFQ